MRTSERITRFGLVNAYLVREDDGLTLIDALTAGSTKAILARARALSLPIVRLLITHGHSDHVGSLDRLAEALPDVEVIFPAREAPLLAGDLSHEPGEPKTPIRRFSFPRLRTSPSRLIRAGDTVGSLRAYAAPGHSPGQLAYLDERDGTLYCGDAYSTLGGTVKTSAELSLPVPIPALFTWDRPLALASAGALLDLEPRTLATGHGKVVTDPHGVMAEAIRRAT